MTTLDFEREQAALIGRISAGLAHDLNGPVGVILGFTELAAEIVAADDSGNGLQAAETRKIAGYLEMIEQSALRARVNAVLLFLEETGQLTHPQSSTSKLD